MKNKELTALECVEELKRLLADSHIKGKWSKQTHDYFSNIVETIEITLKAYEKTLDGLDAEMRKNQKALEIIKEKKVNLEYLKCCENYEQYKTICSYWNEITQEQFDLLKEVLKQ